MSEKKTLLDALEPFARAGLVLRDVTRDKPDDFPLREMLPGIWPTLGDLRRASKVWKELGGKL